MARFTNPPGDWIEGYHAQFYSTTTQVAPQANIVHPVVFEHTSYSQSITVEQDEQGYYSKIVVANPGVYNIMFSGQIHHLGGGGGGEIFTMWFRRNGIDVPESRTIWHVPNGKYSAPALNIFLSASNAGDYFQLVGYPDNTAIVLETVAASTGLPAVPSMILTVSQVA